MAVFMFRSFMTHPPSEWPLVSTTFRLLSSGAAIAEDKPRTISEMPGIKSYPVVGSSVGLTLSGFDPKNLYKFWKSNVEKYGHISKIKIPGKMTFVGVSRPEDFEKVYRVTAENPIRDGFHSLQKVRYDAIDNYFEKKGGLLTENNEEWWRVRSKVQTPMMKPKNLVKYLPQMDQVSLDFVERIAELQKKHGEMPENFIEELYKWALESVALVAVNKRLGCLDKHLPPDSDQVVLIKTVNKIFELMNITELALQWWRLFPTPSFKKLQKAHDLFIGLVDKHIKEAEELIKKKITDGREDQSEITLLETLLQRDALTRKDVITLILDMFFAGIDTTSHTIGFALYCLAKNRSAQTRLQHEVDSVLGDGRETVTEAQLARLSYLKACVKESLRMFPLVVGNLRTLPEDSVLGGYLVPKGYEIIMLSMVSARSESQFRRATEFVPERWGRDKPLGPIHPYASLPFSHGTRMCIGRRIAEQEIYTLLARIMHRFDVNYKYEDMDLITRLVSLPSQPLKFEFTERSK